jgi:hypothetical protein
MPKSHGIIFDFLFKSLLVKTWVQKIWLQDMSLQTRKDAFSVIRVETLRINWFRLVDTLFKDVFS